MNSDRTTALVLTLTELPGIQAKTAHGLIRDSERFEILGVIDHAHAGQDAGEVVDGVHMGIPVVNSRVEFEAQSGKKADHLVIGVANVGGMLSREWFPIIEDCLEQGMSIVCGMHEFLTDIPRFVELSEKHGGKLIDVRKPKRMQELHFWTGAIHSVPAAKIAVMGTDCAIGKRTLTRLLMHACREAGLKTDLIYTGQTGWMQGGKYGFVLDAVLNDFVAGELEHAIVTCYEETKSDVILIEGQAALRNPSGPCGSEFLVSGDAKGVILVHAPGRPYHKGWKEVDRKIAPLATEVALVHMYGSEVLGIGLNTAGLSLDQAREWQARYEDELGLPVVLPLDGGVEALIPNVKALVK
ncbi:MAG: DUF1611 domain-containing protein [Bacteroidota bacterium]